MTISKYYELGAKAYSNGIRTPAQDSEFMTSSDCTIDQMKEWIKGNDAALQQNLKNKFPELYK